MDERGPEGTSDVHQLFFERKSLCERARLAEDRQQNPEAWTVHGWPDGQDGRTGLVGGRRQPLLQEENFTEVFRSWGLRGDLPAGLGLG